MTNTPKLRVRVYHREYGCDTGCCGHVVECGEHRTFEFEHPYDDDEDRDGWARAFAEQVIRAKWPECLPLIDWSTLEVETSDD